MSSDFLCSFPAWCRGRKWNSIVSVPDHCLFIYFSTVNCCFTLCRLIFYVPFPYGVEEENGIRLYRFLIIAFSSTFRPLIAILVFSASYFPKLFFCVPFPYGVGEGNGIRLYRFLFIAFSSTFQPLITILVFSASYFPKLVMPVR